MSGRGHGLLLGDALGLFAEPQFVNPCGHGPGRDQNKLAVVLAQRGDFRHQALNKELVQAVRRGEDGAPQFENHPTGSAEIR